MEFVRIERQGPGFVAVFHDSFEGLVRLNAGSLSDRIVNMTKQAPTYDASSDQTVLVELQSRYRNEQLSRLKAWGWDGTEPPLKARETTDG